MGNLTNIDYAVSADIHLRYDATNRLTNMVDAAGATRYVYDAAGQLLIEDGPWTDDTVTYTHTNRLRAGLSVAAPSSSPWTQSYGYDSSRRLASIHSPAGTFQYNVGTSRRPGSLVRLLSLPGGAFITNSFDSSARLLSTALRSSANAAINVHSYSYNIANQRTKQTFTEGNFVDYTYDRIGQVKIGVGKEQNGTTQRLHEQLGYSYDAAGNLSFRTNNAMVQSFNVNSLNQLTGGGRVGTWTVSGGTMGSPTTVTVNGSNSFLYADGTFASTNHNPANTFKVFTAIAQDAPGRWDTNTSRMFAPPSPVYEYDLNGNLLVERSAGGVTNRVFRYDDENQLIWVGTTNAWFSEFVYDGKMRRRVRRDCTWTGSGWTTNEVRYIYDGNLVVQERDANNVPGVTYTRGTDLSGTREGAGGIGGLLGRVDHALLAIGDSRASALYHADGNGNITCLIGSNQLVAARYHYDPFGNILGMNGRLAEANLYRFSSKELHVLSGLVYYLYRYYDPSLQRWVNRDPIGELGGNNLYCFVNNSPIDSHDLFGLARNDPPKVICGPKLRCTTESCACARAGGTWGPVAIQLGYASSFDCAKDLWSKALANPFGIVGLGLANGYQAGKGVGGFSSASVAMGLGMGYGFARFYDICNMVTCRMP